MPILILQHVPYALCVVPGFSTLSLRSMVSARTRVSVAVEWVAPDT